MNDVLDDAIRRLEVDIASRRKALAECETRLATALSHCESLKAFHDEVIANPRPSLPAGAPTDRSNAWRGRFYGKHIDAVMAVLAAAKAPLKIKEIAQLLQEGGYYTRMDAAQLRHELAWAVREKYACSNAISRNGHNLCLREYAG